nr:hypothetical protein [Gemmatimonadota bacterium]
VVYCDIEAFGLRSFRISQPSVTGGASARQLSLLYAHHSAVAFRGLTRIEALRESGGIRPNEVDDFSADTTWMAAAARWGELHRVPSGLYRKRYHVGNTHVPWASWPLEKRAKAWTVHCADMLEQAMLPKATEQERRLLWLAAVGRLASLKTASGYLPLATMAAGERAALLEGFFEHVRTRRSMDVPGLLQAGWEEIRRWTRGFYWVPPRP